MVRDKKSGLCIMLISCAGIVWVYFSDIITGAGKIVLGPRSAVAFAVFAGMFVYGLFVFVKSNKK